MRTLRSGIRWGQHRGQPTQPQYQLPPMPLTDTAIRKIKPAKKPIKLFDGGGLYLEVAPAGGKWWRLKYRVAGKEKRLSLGVYPDVGLKFARDRRDDARRLLAEGVDPGEHRKATKAANGHVRANTRLAQIRVEIRTVEDRFASIVRKVVAEKRGITLPLQEVGPHRRLGHRVRSRLAGGRRKRRHDSHCRHLSHRWSTGQSSPSRYDDRHLSTHSVSTPTVDHEQRAMKKGLARS